MVHARALRRFTFTLAASAALIGCGSPAPVTARGAAPGDIQSAEATPGVTLLEGTLTAIGGDGVPHDVLAVAYFANNHPYVDVQTSEGHILTIYAAPGTDRMVVSAPAGFVQSVGAADVQPGEHYGSYAPLGSMTVKASPSDGLRRLPLRALQVSGLPVAVTTGPDSSMGDQPEQAVITLDIDLTATDAARRDARAAGLIQRATAARRP